MPIIRHTIHCFFALFLGLGAANASPTITLLNTYPSDSTAFTQGLERLADGQLLLSTGLYGKSKLGILTLKTGHYAIKNQLPSQFFGEGITQTPYGIWQLTWKEHTAFLYNPTSFQIIKTVPYVGEGWGLAYHPVKDIIYMSDGSSKIQIKDAKTFKPKSTIDVHYHHTPISQLNELEFANGFIYANVWQTNFILKINPTTGDVVQIYDASSLLQHAMLTNEQRQNMDVLNGIAHIQDNRFYLTGKYYPVIFEVMLN